MKTSQKGFSVVEVLLVVVVIGLIGVVGWLVYDRRKSDVTSEVPVTNTQTNQQDDTQETPKDETETSNSIPEGYLQYTSSTGDFTFNYPEDWSEVKSSLDEMTVAYVAPTGTEFPNVYVWTAAKDNSSCNQTSQPTTEVTVAGISAKQFTKSTSAKTVTTCVEKNNKIYHIVHGSIDKEYPDVYAEVLDSFKFK